MIISDVKDIIDYKRFERVAKENLIDISSFSSFVTDLNFNILFQADSLTTLIKKIFLVTNEIYPFSYLYENGKTKDSIVSEFVDGCIIMPDSFLYDNKIQVYCALSNDPDKKNFISYKNMNNLNSEAIRILEFIDSENILKNFLENISVNINDLASEFLWVNEDKPNMLTTDKIIVYSALLNYSAIEIEKTTFFKAYLKTFIKSGNIPLNWDQIRVIFKDFLKELKERTINY